MAKGKILIVDDDPDIALATRLCLESAGYEVFEAHNSETGLEIIQNNRPDLIILDVMMDSTTEGFQMALTLRSPDPNSDYRAYSNIPIIMQTSIHSTTPVRFAPDQDYLPVDKFLDKPVEPEELLKVVAALLKKT
ncbi:MAG: response regulator [Anaerolineaceae bacterium]|nr:response regulator [Anaerolineaceae bacterium]